MERDQVVAGRYRLRELLGAGGSSVLWRARDQVLSRDVALKVFFPGLGAGTFDRLRLAAPAAARLRHRHVTEVYDYGDDSLAVPPVLFLVLELVDGRALAELLAGGALHWRTAVEIGAQAASALAAAHARGIVHGDLTPETVLVAPAGVKIVDFGIAAALGEAVVPPSPEADVYALGRLLRQSLTGESPGDDALPPVPGLPPAVAELCRQCLAGEPSARPVAATVAERLAAVSGTGAATGAVPPRNRHPYASGPRPPASRGRARRS